MDKKIKIQEMGHFEKYIFLYVIYGMPFLFLAPYCYSSLSILIISIILWIVLFYMLSLGLRSQKYDKSTRTLNNIIAWIMIVSVFMIILISLLSGVSNSDREIISILAITLTATISYLIGDKYGNILTGKGTILNIIFPTILLYAGFCVYFLAIILSEPGFNTIG